MIFLMLLFLALSAQAKDKFKLSFLGIRTQNVERYGDVDDDNFQRQRSGFGFLVESEKFQEFSFEGGLLKFVRQYSIKDQNKTIVEEVDRLHLPMSLRWNQSFYSAAAGIYAGYAVSKEERAVEGDFPTDEATSAQESEYGAQYSLSFFHPIKTTEFFIDLRYFEPFASRNSEETNNFMGAVGVRFEI